MNWDLQISILFPALIAGILVLATHVPLGHEVLKRGIIFIDLAIAQIASLGVILAFSFGWESHGWETQLVALLAALLGAWLLGWSETKFKNQQEAFIGIIFVLAATGGLLLLSDNPQGGEHLREILTGQILWISWSDLIPLTAITVFYYFLSWKKWLPRIFVGRSFYFLFAVVITFSVQVVGVYLVFASLIIPAFAIWQTEKKSISRSFFIGILGYCLGIFVSAVFDLPTGASIVWFLAITGLFFRMWFSANKNKFRI